jgi:uncharacterized membrane protein YeaQ/YmgE (transglycosylase-associated protein family)
MYMTDLFPMAADSCADTSLLGWIGTIIFGAVIGALARLVLPGKQSISLLVTIILGIVGALIGYWLAAQIGACATSGIDWIRWLISIIVAAILIVVYERIMVSRSS